MALALHATKTSRCDSVRQKVHSMDYHACKHVAIGSETVELITYTNPNKSAVLTRASLQVFFGSRIDKRLPSFGFECEIGCYLAGPLHSNMALKICITEDMRHAKPDR